MDRYTAGNFIGSDECEIADISDQPSANGIINSPAIQDISQLSQINGPTFSPSYQDNRWDRLSQDYSDQYLEFFISSQIAEDTEVSLEDSQHGSVTWTSSEKGKLFSALTRRGRHDLPGLSENITTKSVVEIRDYLNKLKTAEVEHQMFATHAKNASWADIEAAVEINKDWEDKLEKAADALAAFQDKYDLARVKAMERLWLIDNATADTVDAANENREEQYSRDAAEDSVDEADSVTALNLLQFGTMLDLSKSVFMNLADGSEHGHWTEYAEQDEEPALTVDAAQVFYNIVKSLVQRILQTAIFLAQSRIRSSTTANYTPSTILKDIDVVAALDILNMPTDSWDYWTGFARRSGVRVVLGEHRKGQSESLTLDQVEHALSLRTTRGRRRSLSSIVSQSSQDPEPPSDSEETDTEKMTGDLSRSLEEVTSQNFPADRYEEEPEFSSHSAVVDDETVDESENLGTSDSGVEELDTHSGRKRQRILMEESQDEFLEKLDHAAQIKEEHLLQRILGSSTIKEEDGESLAKKPRRQRKTKEDLKDWSDTQYHALWERKRYPDDTSQEIFRGG